MVIKNKKMSNFENYLLPYALGNIAKYAPVNNINLIIYQKKIYAKFISR